MIDRPALDPLAYDGHDLEALADLPNYQGWILDVFKPYLGGRCIEFGAGVGAFSKLLRPSLERLEAVEPSSNLTAKLSRLFEGDGGAIVIEETLESFAGKVEDTSVDTIVMVNVLEHILDDRHALDEFFRILKPGGHLLLFVPAMKFLFSAMDQNLGHYRRYQLKELREKVESPGFNIILSRYFDFLGTFAWYLVHTLGGKQTFNPSMAHVYDTVCVPITRNLERIMPVLFGKNVIMVARKQNVG